MTKLDELVERAKKLPERDRRWVEDLLTWEVDQASHRSPAHVADAFRFFVESSKHRSPQAWRFSREEIYAERLERYRPRLP